MRVIGTAGHVDHGKSTLVKALTGINPDRLREEQEREMTIDLGFAWVTLPGGEEIGIVDVPGHRDFIDNMLAGVGSIDGGLLVVAADEGVMPQTKEHVAILDLLAIRHGVVALTKIDLVDDAEWMDLVEQDVEGLLASTNLAGSALVRVSARTGEGLDELAGALERLAGQTEARIDRGLPRLSIDRVFTMSGFGTVVTGTLVDGRFQVGEDVEVLPGGLRSRIRGLQPHKSSLESALPGSRVAINLTGLDAGGLRRGDTIVRPGTYGTTKMLDVHFRLVADAPASLVHNQEVKLFIGAAQRMARVRTLGTREVDPGEEAWLQLVLDEPVVAAKGDRFILRRPSPSATLGGGEVVDAQPQHRHRISDTSILDGLERAYAGSPEDQIEQVVMRQRVIAAEQAIRATGLEAHVADEALLNLAKAGRVILLGGAGPDEAVGRLIAYGPLWAQMKDELVKSVEAYHAQHPLRDAMPQEALRGGLRLSSEVFGLLLEAALESGLVVVSGTGVRSSSHEVLLSPDQEARVESLMAEFESKPYNPPSVKECTEAVGKEVFFHQVASRQLIQIADDVVLSPEVHDLWLGHVVAKLEAGEEVTVASLRDEYGTSRKYSLAFLEYLDQTGVTLRRGDRRILNPARK